MANLLEAYSKRLALAESVHQKSHEGEGMSSAKKMAVARCLDNTAKFLTEAFNNSVGTQRSDLGAWKKFSLDLTNVALPNLIAFDLVLVYPMSSLTGYINYVQYTTGSNKGTSNQGDVINDPFRLGKVDKDYTSERVVETFDGDGTTTEFTVAWTPVIAKRVNEAGEETYAVKALVDGTAVEVAEVDEATGKITLAEAPAADSKVRIAYIYDNVVVPQNDLPLINAHIESMPLLAHARRVAVYYLNRVA